MADEDDTLQDIPEAGDPTSGGTTARRRRQRAALASGAVVAMALGYLWTTREDIAGNIIQSRLDEYGIAGTYRIESVGTRRQVLSHIVIGDPRHPDLTVERAEVTIVPTLGLPRIGSVRLVRPRLYGEWREGRMSFGALDKYLYERKTEEPTRLPDIILSLEDGRARIVTPFGQVGVKAEGKGNLQNGFGGIVAAIAPQMEGQGCKASRLSLFGKVTTSRGRPKFSGPLRIPSVDCGGSLGLKGGLLTLDAASDRDLATVELKSGLRAGSLRSGASSASAITGKFGASWRKGTLSARYDLSASSIVSPAMRLAHLQSAGSVRARNGVSSFEWQGDLNGRDMTPGSGLASSLSDWRESAGGTLLAPILSRIDASLRRETTHSRLAADFTLRRRDGQLSLVVPNATLRGASGASLVTMSRVQVGFGTKPYLTGNFTTSGNGLPRLSGRMEQATGGPTLFRLSMPEYAAGTARLALPELLVAQRADGALGFAGRVLATGELPGGFVEGLDLPLSGSWSDKAGLAMWRDCTRVSFRRLALAGMELARPSLQFCPTSRGVAIVRSGPAGTHVAARVPGLDLAGRLGESPLRIRGGAVAIGGGLVALKDLDVTLGPSNAATRFALSKLDMRLGQQAEGRFSGADFGLYAVPIDLRGGSGAWRYADGRLTISGATLGLEDRQINDRFQPLLARDAELALADNVITASALLRNPESDRAVTALTLRHDLSTGIGKALLSVKDLRFDDKLQPDMLSRLALGVVANASGSIAGEGRIAWDQRGVTSTGEFGSRSLDFAAAFGPAQGVAGTIHFTDLIGLTTAPDQRITVRSINPGIEVFDGQIGYELIRGEVLSLHDAHWPFLGGTLVMDPVAMRIGVAETRRYVLHLNGVEAGQFVERMEMGNLSATGTFDGTIPLVFDENGGRVDRGILEARPPGGNLSYVGELTYKDLTPMANIAFDALRSLDYRQMRVELDGPLTGEIVTRVKFDGIRQGATAKRNILTQQIAKLPIRFNVNIHAPFYRLITSLKSMYDPALVRDPRELGLLDRNGNPVARPELRPQAVLPKEITDGK